MRLLQRVRRAWVWVVAIGMLASPAAAQVSVTPDQQARFIEALKVFGDARTPGVIDVDELSAFLLRELPRRTWLNRTIVTPDFARREALRLMNEADTNGDIQLDALEFEALLEKPIRVAEDLAPGRPSSTGIPTVDFRVLLPRAAIGGTAGPALADRLAGWLQIRQSFLDEKLVEKPATFSFATFDETDETVEDGAGRVQWATAAAAIATVTPWTVHIGGFEAVPVMAYEVKLSSGKKKDVNAITHRFGVTAESITKSGRFKQTLDATFDYGTDRGYDAQVLGATFQYSPAVPVAGVGRLLAVSGSAVFVVQPSIGFTYGELKNSGERTGLDDFADFADFYTKVVSKITFVSRVSLLFDLTGFRQLKGEKSWRAIGELLLNVYITPEASTTPVSVQVGGVIGAKSPAFKQQQSANVALAIKF